MDNLSFAQAREMVGDAYCSLKRIISTKHIPLPARYIGNPNKGIKELLDSIRKKYSSRHNGVVMAYGNIQRLQSEAVIVEEQPVLHFDIKGEFVLFQPSVGDIVKATVNKKGKDFVGCVVHGCFNAAMPLLQQESSLELGEEVLMEVTSLQVHNQLLSMKGRLHQRLCEANLGLSPDLNLLDSILDSTSSEKHGRKKRKRKSSECTGALGSPILSSVTSPKQKRRKVDANCADDFALESSVQATHTQKHSECADYPGSPHEVGLRKKKRSRNDSCHNDRYALNKSSEIHENSHNESKTERKKKKKRKKRDSLSSDSGILAGDEWNSHLDSSVNFGHQETKDVVSRISQTTHGKDQVDVDSCSSNIANVNDPCTSGLSENSFLSPDANRSKHKKKKKKKKSQGGE